LTGATGPTGPAGATGCCSGTETVYNTAGVGQSGSHITVGTGTLPSGGGTKSVTITLSGSAKFGSATSFVCNATDTSTTGALQVNQSGYTNANGQFVVSGNAGDSFNFVCVGN
jgi:hypothetical protein